MQHDIFLQINIISQK